MNDIPVPYKLNSCAGNIEEIIKQYERHPSTLQINSCAGNTEEIIKQYERHPSTLQINSCGGDYIRDNQTI